jgi:hypothetical protein
MSNYQNEGHAPYEGSPPPTGAYAGGGSTSVGEGQAYPPSGPPPQWQGQPGYQGQQSGFGGHGQRSLNVRSTFKTTEFWIFVVVSIALLIAAAVTDKGDDNQAFGAQDAWRYVTALAIAYILSRGLTKFGGHERDDHDHR